MTAPRRMTLGSMLAYGSGDFYGGGSLFIKSTLYVVFLTTIVGVSPVSAGSIIMVGQIASALANPLMGYISDHTKSRFGRRRVWFLAGLLPAFTLLWIPMRFSDEGLTVLWHMMAYLVFNLLFNIVKVPYNSILAEMTADYGERSRATGIRMMFSYAGALLGAALPLTIIKRWGGGGSGYLAMGIIFGILYAIPWIFEFFYTWERDIDVERAPGSLLRTLGDLFRAFASTLRNRTFAIHMGMYLTAFMNLDMFNALAVFYVTLSLGHDADLARNTLSIVQGSQLVALPLVTILCYRIGNAATYRLSLVVWGCGILTLATLQAGSGFSVMAGCAVVTGLGLSGAVLTPWNIQSFMADVDELMTTQRREGVYAGFMQFCRQLAIGLALFGTNMVLQASGFVKGATMQPSSVGVGVRVALIVAPLVLLSAGIALSLRFKLDPANHAIMLAEIARLREGGRKEDVTPQVRKLCEQLTGQPYERLWDPQLAH